MYLSFIKSSDFCSVRRTQDVFCIPETLSLDLLSLLSQVLVFAPHLRISIRRGRYVTQLILHNFRDMGVMDENGAISLQGRHADAVRFKVSAEVVYPGPIEVVLCGIPAIRAAQVSGLFGHTNITWTHTPRNAAQQHPYFFSTVANLHLY